MDLDPSEVLLQKFRLPPEETWALTPDERMERFWKLQEDYFAALRADPVAYDAFIRRNLRKRAIDWREPQENQAELVTNVTPRPSPPDHP